MPEFFRAVGAARFGVMAGVAAALTAFFLYVAGALTEPAKSVLFSGLDPRDATAVTAFNTPASQYSACHRFHTSITCVAPHATMNVANNPNIQPNGKSRRLRMNHSKVNGIVKYDPAISTSEITCSQTNPGFHR